MSEENIQQVTKINPAGKYIIQFPEGTSEDVRKQFDELLENARKEGRNVYLEPGVTAIDINQVTKAPEPTPLPVEQPAPVIETPAIAPPVQEQPVQQVQQPVQQLPPGYIQPEQIIFAQPVPVAQGQAYQYNPFATMPQMVAPQQVAPPVYYPGMAPAYGWVQTPQGYVQVQQQRVYNPQLAEGPIGQVAPKMVAPAPNAPPQVAGGKASTQHQPYTSQ